MLKKGELSGQDLKDFKKLILQTAVVSVGVILSVIGAFWSINH
jgi:hypothetical protein